MDLEEFELINEKDCIQIERSFLLSRKDSIEPEENGHWSNTKRKKWTVLLFLGCLLVYSTRTSLSISVVPMGKELGWNKQLSGFVMSTFFFGYILTQIAGGILADRYGGDYMLLASSLVWSISTLLIPVVGDFFRLQYTMSIIVLRAASGIAQGIHFPAVASLISKRVGHSHRNSVFAIAASGTAAGNVLNGFAGSLILEYYGWRSVFYSLGALSLLWVLTIQAMVKRNGKNRTPISGNYKEKRVSFYDIPWCLYIKSKGFWALIIASACESFVFTNLLSWLPTYFAEKHPGSKGWQFNVLPWATSFLFQNISGTLSDHMIQKGWQVTTLRKFFVTLAGGAACLICLRFLMAFQSFNIALFYMSFMVGCLGTNTSGLAMNPQDLAPEHAGSMFGLMNTISAISGMVGVYITGYLLESSKDWTSVFLSLSIVSAIGFVTFLFFGTGKKIEN